MTKWLLMEHMTVSLSDDTDTPTFYQTLAGVTHCKFKQTLSPLSAWNLYICTWICTELIFLNYYLVEETDISELEKRYWTLKSQSKSGKFDLDTFKAMVCPPVPEAICESKCIVKGFWISNLCWCPKIFTCMLKKAGKKCKLPLTHLEFTRRFLSLDLKKTSLIWSTE